MRQCLKEFALAVVVATLIMPGNSAMAELPSQSRETATYVVTGIVINVKSVKSSWTTYHTTTLRLVDVIKGPSLKVNDKFMITSFNNDLPKGYTGAGGHILPPKVGDTITAYAHSGRRGNYKNWYDVVPKRQ